MKTISLKISSELAAELEADEQADGIPVHDRIRRGLAAMVACRRAQSRGFPHMGFATHSKQLDIELVGVL